MFAFIRQLFSALSAFCLAFEKVGQSTVNLATIGEEMSNTYLDDTRAQRKIAQIRMAKQLRDEEAKALKLAGTDPVTDVEAK